MKDKFTSGKERGICLPRNPRKATRRRMTRIVLCGALLSTLALMPFISNFMPKAVDYRQSAETVRFRVGTNRVNNLVFTLDAQGRLQAAHQIYRQAIGSVFGFKNLRNFFGAGMPFLSLLSLCFFFIWYDRQEKDRHLLKLKRVVLGIFSFTALWFTYWIFIPESKPDPVPYPAYYIVVHLLTAVSLLGAYYLHKRYPALFKIHYGVVRALVRYIVEVRDKHYRRMAIKALASGREREKTYREIEEYEQHTFEALGKVKRDY